MHEVSKEASKAWKEMPANEKQYWDSISKKDKEEYEKKLVEFEGPLQVRTDRVKKKVCVFVCVCWFQWVRVTVSTYLIILTYT